MEQLEGILQAETEATRYANGFSVFIVWDWAGLYEERRLFEVTVYQGQTVVYEGQASTLEDLAEVAFDAGYNISLHATDWT